jgi:hypothetical protein
MKAKMNILAIVCLAGFLATAMPVSAASAPSRDAPKRVKPRCLVTYELERAGKDGVDKALVTTAREAISSVLARSGYRVMDAQAAKMASEEVEMATLTDTDTDAMADLALKDRAELLVLYSVAVQKKAKGASQYFGGADIRVAMRALAPATGEEIARKTGNVLVRTDRRADEMYAAETIQTGTRKLAGAVAKALVAAMPAALSHAVTYDVWFQGFEEKQVYAVMELLKALGGVEDTDLRNQTESLFEVNVVFKGRKLDLQRKIEEALDTDAGEGSWTLRESKGSRLVFMQQ